jgi:hypothetical protein
MKIEEVDGTQRALDRITDGSVICRLKPNLPGIPGVLCTQPSIPPGGYRIDIPVIASGMFLRSATVSGRDVLSGGLQVDADIDLEVVLGLGGGRIHGHVTSSEDSEGVGEAIVALVPSGLSRNAMPLYRSSVSDILGNFEIESIAPGDYHLFAWRKLEGETFRNPQFMDQYAERGTPVRVRQGETLAADLVVIDQR